MKYIPELQEQVEGLVKKKEELVLRISRQCKQYSQRRNIGHHIHNSVFYVSTNRLSDFELVIQISSFKLHKIPLSHILHFLEQHHHNNLLLLNASSFRTFEDRVFYHLHFQVYIYIYIYWHVSRLINDF